MKDFKVYQASGYLKNLVTDASDVRKVYEEISGSLVQFDTPISAPLESLIVVINPVQDLHGQDAPYPAGGGKNIFQTTAESKTESGVTWTVNEDGSVTVTGTATGGTTLNVGVAYVDSSMGEVAISLDGISATTNISINYIRLCDASDAEILRISAGGLYPIQYTVDLNEYPTAHHIIVSVKRNNNVTTNGTLKVQVEKGSNFTTWQPYSNICPITGWTGCEVWVKDEYDTTLPPTLPVTFPDSAGTVYGGTVDVVSGKLIVDRIKHSPTSCYTYNAGGYGNIVVPNGVGNLKLTATSNISDMFKFVYPHTVSINNFEFRMNANNAMFYQIRVEEATTKQEMNDWLSANQPSFILELEEPIEIQLTPQEINTLIGVNNIWADTGDVSVKYRTH